MKKFLLLISVLVVTCSLMAQTVGTDTVKTKKGKVYLDLTAGYSMAFGEYTANDREDKLAGFASNGFLVSGAVSWCGSHGFGLGVGYNYQNNPLQQEYADDTLVDMNEALGTKHWNNHYLMAGPVFYKPLGKWLINAKMLIGVNMAYSPLFALWMPSTDTLNPEAVTKSEGPGFGLAFQALAGIGYRLTDRLFINLAISYLGANPSRKKEYSMYLNPEPPEVNPVYIQGERERNKKISSFNINLGIAFKL